MGSETAIRRIILKEQKLVKYENRDLLGVRIVDGNFLELFHVVEGHLVYSSFTSMADKSLGLARVGVDDLGRVNSTLQNNVNLFLAGAVETGSEGGQYTDEDAVSVAFHGVERLKYQF